MMNQSRCQRKIIKNIVGRKLTQESFSLVNNLTPEKKLLFEYYMNRFSVTRCFSIGYKWLATIIGVGRTSVKKWVNDFIELGFVEKQIRYNVAAGKNHTNTYSATPYLKVLMKVLLPLLPSLYSVCKADFPRYIHNIQTVLVTACYNKDIYLLRSEDRYIDLFSSYSLRLRAMLDTIRSEEIRVAALSLTYGGPGAPNVTWVRGNAPEFDNSTVEKEREMNNEDYEALNNSDAAWYRAPHGPATQSPLAPTAKQPYRDVPSHKQLVQNYLSKSSNSHQRNEGPGANAPRRHTRPTQGDMKAAGITTTQNKNDQPIANSETKKRIDLRLYNPPVIVLDEKVERLKFANMCVEMKRNNPTEWAKQLKSEYGIKYGIRCRYRDKTDEEHLEILHYMINDM